MTTTATRTPRQARQFGRWWQPLLAMLGAVALLAAACGDDDDDVATDNGGTEEREGPPISIGAQDFQESAIVSEIYQQALEAEGFDASIQQVGGFRDLLFAAFEAGDVNLAPEYVASELDFLEEGLATSDVDESMDELQPLLDDMGLVALEPSDAVNTNVVVVTQETADDLGLSAVSDLADHADDLTLGALADCEENAFCIPGLQRIYDIDLTDNFVPLDYGLIATSLEEGAIDVGFLFSTDAVLDGEEFLVLDDDEDMFAADNVFPLATQDLVEAYGDDLVDVLDGISAALTTDDLIDMNSRHDVDREDPDVIAADWLDENDI
jgi:osmoprotectant transport system substrate-binding protein